MVKCSANNCGSSSHTKTQGISFHRFPKDTKLRELWLVNMNRRNWKPKQNSLLCSKHFENQYLDSSKFCSNLRPGAVPTIFVQIPESEELLTPPIKRAITLLPVQMSEELLTPPIKRTKTLLPVQMVGDVGSSLRQENTQNDITRLPQVRMIIAGVYRYLHVEYNNLKSYLGDTCDLSPLANIRKRTAEATGVSEETVTIILEKEKSSAKSRDTPKMRSKRAKFNGLSENEDVSSDEEESSCESSRNVQKSDAESDEEEEEEQYEPIETLKLEFEEDMDHSKYINERKRIEIESTPCQMTSTVHNWLPLTQTSVKPEPLDAEEEQLTPAALHVASEESLDPLKSEPDDHTEWSPVALHQTPEERLDPLKSEPDDYPYT